jgi:hypothetical protein
MTERATDPQDERRLNDDQGSAGRSGEIGEDALRHERDTPDNKERTIEHGAEQYYRRYAPDDGPLDPGDEPEAPGKVPRGRSAT